MYIINYKHGRNSMCWAKCYSLIVFQNAILLWSTKMFSHSKNEDLKNSCEFEPHSWRGVLDTTLCDQVCQWLATGWWFSPVSSTNKTDHHDKTEILLKVLK
jgi:hypothetical protein